MSARTLQAGLVTWQGHYAGSVSRFAAYVIDLAVSTGVFTLGLAAISYGVQIVAGHSVGWNRSNTVVAIIFIAWQFFYFGYSWAVSGKTFGMAVLGIRVVRVDGSDLDPRRAVVRALVFPLSFLLFGLGFLGILVQREHRALHDLIAGTAVIYAWDARAARLRFLARRAELPASDRPRPGPSRLPGLPITSDRTSLLGTPCIPCSWFPGRRIEARGRGGRVEDRRRRGQRRGTFRRAAAGAGRARRRGAGTGPAGARAGRGIRRGGGVPPLGATDRAAAHRHGPVS